jgi:hypothetical protein
MARRVALALVLSVLATVAAAPAAAQQDPFGPLPQAPQPQQPAPVPAEEEDEGLSGTQQLLIVLGGLALLLGIGFAIVRDAGSAAGDERARVSSDRVGGRTGLDAPKATRAPPQSRAARSRARTKAQRQARKKNRPA